MGTTPTKVSLFFLLFTLFLQLHARESQFFSKFTPRENELLTTTIQPQQQDPNFIPQTNDSTGYGLYAHLPPSTTTTSATNGGADDTLPENDNTVAYTTLVGNKDSFDATVSQYASKNQYNGYSSMHMNNQDKFYGHLPPLTTTPDATNGGADDNLPTTLPKNYNTVAYTTPMHTKDSYVTTPPQYANKDQYNGDSSMYMNNKKQDKLYDHLPPLTTTPAATNGGADDNLPTTLPENYNTVAYTTPIHSKDSFDKDQYNGDSSMYNNQYMYNSQKQGMSETRFMDTGKAGADGRNMYNNEKQGMTDGKVLDNGKYYHVGDMYNPEEQGMGKTRFMDKWDGSTTNDGKMYNTEKQGMSDTRYMENRKYDYDLDSEGYNPQVFYSRNGYKYNDRGYYGNNDNSYNMYNSNARFQENQEVGFTFTP